MQLMAIQEIMGLQRFITEQAQALSNTTYSNQWEWHGELFRAIRPNVPENKQPLLDILIKCAELGALLDSWGGATDGRV